MREREDIVHCSSASADRAVVSFSFSFFYYYLRLALVPCRESVRQGWHAGAVAVPVTRRAAKNSDFVRVIGFFNPPLRVRTDIYAINDLFGLWTRYKIGINLNYSDTSHFAHAHGTS